MRKIHKKIIKHILAKPAPKRIPRTDERAKDVDCNVLYIRTKDESWSMLINSCNEMRLKGKKWEKGNTQDHTSIAFDELDDPNVYLDIIHFYEIYDFRYTSLRSYFLNVIVPINRLKIFLHKFGLFISNRKQLVRSERMYILQLILEKSLDNSNYKAHAVQLMTELHTQAWVYHPDKDRQIAYNKLLLKSLEGTGDLEAVTSGYKITGKALETLSKFELEVKQHKQSLTQARAITFLTLVLVVVGCVQAYIASGNS